MVGRMNRPYVVDKCPNCGTFLRGRTGEQNNGMHAVFDDIAKQQDWPRGSGQKLDGEAWKRLLMAAYERANNRAAEFYPALDGHGFDVVYRRTSKLSKREASEFMEFVFAWCAEQGLNVGLEAA
jgi:hypothetical protein